MLKATDHICQRHDLQWFNLFKKTCPACDLDKKVAQLKREVRDAWKENSRLQVQLNRRADPVDDPTQ